MKARLPSSPYVSLALYPDARAAILTRRTFRTFERRPVPSLLRVAAAWPERHRAPLEEMVDQDTFGAPWHRAVGSEPGEDRQPRAAAARRISPTTDA